MTTFEIISAIVLILGFLGVIVGVYIKSAIAIAKIQVEIVEIKRDLITKEIAILNIEKNNREDFRINKEDHNHIIAKIDKLVDVLIK